MTNIEAALRDMLGPFVAVAITDPRAQVDDLLPEEQVHIARALPKRRFEFAAGRRAARRALAELGLPPAPIAQAPDRTPIWPEGVTGSITHCDTLCIAALVPRTHHRGLGLDIEPATPLAAELHDIICTAAERRFLACLPAKARGLEAKRIFCAKEAFYKAHSPLSRHDISFQDVSLSSRPQQGLFQLDVAAAAAPTHIEVRHVDQFYLAACWMA
jgi:4'-phosphopantetheinyl transferase EntD